jgi:tetratricopeptide (TPR) repeat protein
MTGLIDIWRNWRERRNVLREVRRDRADAREWAYFRFKDGMTEALVALERDDRRRATEIWLETNAKYPGEALNSPLALDVLNGLQRFDEAEALMNEGRTKTPGDMRFAIGLALVARARGDSETASQRWASVRKQFPGVMQSYAMGVEALRDLKRLQEAEALTQQTIARFPEEVLGYMEHARLADLQEDWKQALERWNVVLTRFDHLSGYTGVAQAMVKFGRYDEADALLTRARVRYPTEPAPSIGLAQSAQARGDVAEAVVRWKRVAQRFPLHAPAVFSTAGALDQLGATADAEEVLRDAVDHFPDEPRALAELGMLLLRRQDFTAAAETFATLRGYFPDHQASYLHGADALTQAGRPDEAEALREEYRRRFK